MKTNTTLNRSIFLLTILIFAGFSLSAQGEWDFSSDFNSRYVWRGMDFGASPSIQPGITYSHSGFAIGAWGAYSVNGSQAQEADLFLSYTGLNDMISVGVTDYFFPNDTLGNNDYFNYKSNETGHLFEAFIQFNGTENLPLTFLVASNIYGDDLNSAGKSRFSSYAELGYSFTTNTDLGLDIFLGANLTTRSNDDITAGVGGFYADKAGIVNMGITASKDIPITEKFALPVRLSLIANPTNNNIFMVFGFTL